MKRFIKVRLWAFKRFKRVPDYVVNCYMTLEQINQFYDRNYKNIITIIDKGNFVAFKFWEN